MKVNTENPWKTLDSIVHYSNPWISVSEHQVISPGGKAGIYGTVHFKSDAVGIVPFDGEHIWLVGQFRYALDQYSWEIPEGGSPQGEEPLETAKRELLEETGLSAQTYDILFEMHLSNSVSDEWGIVYLATGLQQGEAQPEHTEELSVRKISLEQAFQEVESFRITDSLTIAAIYKLMLLKSLNKL
ncbi:MAG: NUDIX hydrolase [Bacteroidota bacterium]